MKYWRIILDALIIIALIVGVFIFNPFGLFGPDLRLKNTASLLSNVQAIGQLVTAEYYGEVIASLNESELNLMQEDQLTEEAEDFYRWIKLLAYQQYESEILNEFDEKDIVKNVRKIRRKKRELVDQILTIYNNDTPQMANVVSRFETGSANQSVTKNKIVKTRHDTTDVVLMYLAREVFGEKLKMKKVIDQGKRDRLRESQVANLVNHIQSQYWSLSENDFSDFLVEGFPSYKPFSEFYFEFKEEALALKGGRKRAKKRLAMIGRGSVKAGFDFGALDEHTFKYDKENATVHLFGVEAKILNSDINPWFIPERQVPGFDIVSSNGSVTFEDAKVVKSYCKRKLEKYAIDADILKEANRFGEEGLKEFFGLMTGDEIKEVHFHANSLNQLYELVSQDSVVTPDEINSISNGIKLFLAEEPSGDLTAQRDHMMKQFMVRLKMLPLKMSNGATIPLNYYTLRLPKMLEDSVLEKKEWTFLKRLRPQLLQGSQFHLPEHVPATRVWFLDSLQTIEDYNAMLGYMELDAQVAYLDIENRMLDYTDQQNNLNEMILEISNNLIEPGEQLDSTKNYLSYAVSGSVVSITEVTGAYSPNFKSTYFNFNTDRSLIERAYQSNIWPIDVMIDKQGLTKGSRFDKNSSMTNGKVVTLSNQQKNEERAYQNWLVDLSERYEKESVIVHARDWIKENFAVKRKISAKF